MSENDFVTAEKLISQAEALGVDYGPFCFGGMRPRGKQCAI